MVCRRASVKTQHVWNLLSGGWLGVCVCSSLATLVGDVFIKRVYKWRWIHWHQAVTSDPLRCRREERILQGPLWTIMKLLFSRASSNSHGIFTQVHLTWASSLSSSEQSWKIYTFKKIISEMPDIFNKNEYYYYYYILEPVRREARHSVKRGRLITSDIRWSWDPELLPMVRRQLLVVILSTIMKMMYTSLCSFWQSVHV